MTITAEEILDNITRYGIEFYRVYPGIYRGIVTANNDPRKQGRIQAHVPTIGDRASTTWIKPMALGAGDNRGIFWPPEVGDPVYVSYAEGQPTRPECYFGGWFGYRDDDTDVPENLGYSGDYPDIRGMVTRMGHKLIFSDADGDERVELIWNKPNASDAAKSDRTVTASEGSVSGGGGTASIKFTPNGSIEITDNSNPAQTIILDSQSGKIEISDKTGNKVTLSASGAVIDAQVISLGQGATEPLVKGQQWLIWAAAHTHPTSVGPSGPPTTPPTPALLSQVSKTK